MLMDEIFGEENFVTEFIWKKKSGGASDVDAVATDHEYILLYSKSSNRKLFLDKEVKVTTVYNLVDEQGRKYGLDRLDKQSLGYQESLDFPIKGPDGRIYRVEHKDPKNKVARWRWSKETVEERYDELVFKWPYVYTKNYEKDAFIPRSLLIDERFGRTRTGKTELKSIFGGSIIFEHPKPSRLIKHLLAISTEQDDIILDSFAGSGTTAHAVLALNKEDGGNRKFILVEMEDYADRITAERMRRVIKGVPTAKDENLKNGLGGSFTFVELGEAIDNEGILSGKRLPSFVDMARYVFYTATGKNINEKKIKESTGFIGETEEYEVYLLYKPNLEWLKTTALDLEKAKKIAGKKRSKKKLVFAPAKYLDEEALKELNIEFAQLPFGIYRR